MPEISRFLGIVVAMFYSDHAPPHFHARYGEYEVTISIGDRFRRWAVSSAGSRVLIGMVCSAP
jgi:hypothetical protein